MAEFVLPPAGVSAASAFTPAVFADPSRPPQILADDIDPKTGELRNLFGRVHPIDAAIREQLRLRRGSGFGVAEQGQDFRRITHNGESAEAELRAEIARIFRPFVDRGHAVLERIDIVTPVPGDSTYAAMRVVWRNLLTRRLESEPPAPVGA